MTPLIIAASGPAQADTDYTGSTQVGNYSVLDVSVPNWPNSFTGDDYTRNETSYGGFGNGMVADDQAISAANSYISTVASNTSFQAQNGTYGGSQTQNNWKGWIKIERLT